MTRGTRTHLRRFVAAIALVGALPPITASAARTETSAATRPALVPSTATPPSTLTAEVDDVLRLSILVRNQIARRHDARHSDVFATVDGLALHLPAHTALAVGYHEARAEHLAMSPSVTSHVVMPSRDRDGAPTSAVDVVMTPGEDVLAPVTGRISKVVDYLLYDEYADVQIEIVPDNRPDLVITMYHLEGPLVHEGQRVEAGTPIADGARSFDFVAQVEQWARGPHVDLRVRRA